MTTTNVDAGRRAPRRRGRGLPQLARDLRAAWRAPAGDGGPRLADYPVRRPHRSATFPPRERT